MNRKIFLLAVLLSVIFLFSNKAEATCGDPVVYNSDTYRTVQIGDQCWFKDNLKTVKYKDGTDILNLTDTSNWSTDTTGAYVWYNNDIANKNTYGALYNQYATTNTHGLCPQGWRVPTNQDGIGGPFPPGYPGPNNDWGVLINTSLGGMFDAYDKLMPGGSSGFDALFSGFRGGESDGYSFLGLGSNGNFWSSSLLDQSYSGGDEVPASWFDADLESGLGNSVRCMKDIPVLYTLNYSAGSGGTITGTLSQTAYTGEDGTAVTAVPNTGYSFARWSDGSTQNPRIDTNILGNISTTALFDSILTTCGNSFSYNSDIYRTVQIGNQCWFKDNLKTTFYRDGSSIQNPTTAYDWSNNFSGAYVWLYGDIANRDLYGAFYNWYAASSSHDLCPEGWRVPTGRSNVSSDDWTTLINYLGGMIPANAKLLNGGSSGFNALMGGYLGVNENTPNITLLFDLVSEGGEHWSSTSSTSDTGNEWGIYNPGTSVLPTNDAKGMGHNVRCIVDHYHLNYSTGDNGTVTGMLSQTINPSASGTSVTAVPNTGYHFLKWSDDSIENPRTDTNVTGNYELTAIFEKTHSSSSSSSSSSGSLVIPIIINDLSTPPPSTNQLLVACSGNDLFNVNTGNRCNIISPNIMRTLKLTVPRMIGPDIKDLQIYLNNHNYNCGITDGIFGKKTKASVIKFQLANGLVGDGIVGPKTKALMK